MLIINADDWGGWREATDAALACYRLGRLTSVTAMVFMEDSERAARIACQEGLDVGLHLNLTHRFTSSACPESLQTHIERTSRFLRCQKYAPAIYHPFLVESFRQLYQIQAAEFERLYNRHPTHVDGHHHMHLCTNMLLSNFIPAGRWVRRSFTYWPGERSRLNRAYRSWVDRQLARRFQLTDYFFCLAAYLREKQLSRIAHLARTYQVELMTHPERGPESEYLLGENMQRDFEGIELGRYDRLLAA